MDAATPAALSESSKISFLKRKAKKKTTAFQASLSREDEVLAYYNKQCFFDTLDWMQHTERAIK